MTQQIQAAWAYEQLFVPSLFAPWASIVADIAEVGTGHHVLDIACGTGVLAREMQFRAGQYGRINGIDITPGMIEVARKISPQINWHVCDAVELPFDKHHFDRVVSQFGLMFFSDKVNAMKQILHVLKPGGLLTVAVWDSVHNIPAFTKLVDVLDRVAGREAGDVLRTPFVLGDQVRLKTLAEQAGINLLSISTHERKARFPNIRTMVEAELRGWLPVMQVFLDETTVNAVLNEADQALAEFITPENKLEFPITAHLIRGSNMSYA